MTEIKSIISADIYNRIIDIYDKRTERDEFEIIFSKDDKYFTYDKYLATVYYAIEKKNDKSYSVVKTKVLDVILNMDNRNYRITVLETDKNKIIDLIKEMYYKQNYIIFNILLERALNNPKDYVIISKEHNASSQIDVKDTPYPLRFRLSTEMPLDKDNLMKLSKFVSENSNMLNNSIVFRYKERLSLVNVSGKISVDITSTKTSNSLRILEKDNSYELELECLSVPKNEYKSQLSALFTQLINVMKVLEGTDILISSHEVKEVIDYYTLLVGLKEHPTHLRLRNPITLDIHYAVSKLPNHYAVTDKADGQRRIMVCKDKSAYLISPQMKVMKLSISADKLDGTILDGEYLTNGIYLAFDILINRKKDVRVGYDLKERLKMLDDIVKTLGSVGKMFNIQEYYDVSKEFNLKKIGEHYNKQVKEYYKYVNGLKGFCVLKKLYLFPYGGSDTEIFLYSTIIWNNKSYELDGLIYTPLEDNYYGKNDPEFKWKPPNQNSIDFYIMFEKDTTNGNILVLYDNSNSKANRPYVVAQLHVGGARKGNQETPVPFVPHGGQAQTAIIYLENASALPKDITGKVIVDLSVVEFSYELESKQWIALRTRPDKTYMANKYKMNMGNNVNVAQNIWKAILENFTMNDMIGLTQPDSYSQQVSLLTSRGVMPPARAYYEKKTELAKPMRAFHNWIKSNIISIYCSAMDNEHKKNILDIGCGRGGDLHKIALTKPKLYVGIEPDYANLFTIEDCAEQRYKQMKAEFPAKFIHASGESDLSTKLDTKILFDVISVQFAVHYLLVSEKHFDSFCENINALLNNGGYLLITCMDGDEVAKAIGEADNYKIEYTGVDGVKNVLIDIKKLYNNTQLTGTLIDLYNATISSSGVYIKEALVFQYKLIKALRDKCGLELIDTDSFTNQFTSSKRFFAERNEKRFDQVKRYYELLDVDFKPQEFEITERNIAKASMQFTNLHRYFVFQKRVTTITKVDRMLFLPDSIQPINDMYSLAFLKKWLHSPNFYALDSKYKSIVSLKKNILKKEEIKAIGVILVENNSEKVFIHHKGENELLVNDSIKISTQDKADKYIIVYKHKASHYPVVYVADGSKKKIIFSANNKYISEII